MPESRAKGSTTLFCALLLSVVATHACVGQQTAAELIALAEKGVQIVDVELNDTLTVIRYRAGDNASSVVIRTKVLEQLVMTRTVHEDGVAIPKRADDSSRDSETVTLFFKSNRDEDAYTAYITQDFITFAGTGDRTVGRMPTDFLVHSAKHYKSRFNPGGTGAKISRNEDGLLRFGFDAATSLAGILAVIGALLVMLALYFLNRARVVRRASAQFRRRILAARELERKRLAADLHDGPVQDLQLVIRSCLPQPTNGNTEREMASMRALLSDVSRKLRNVCCDLRPPVLVYFGLADAARAHVSQFAERYPNINIDLTAQNNGEEMVSEEIRIALYRILQESLVNVVKHAQAKNVHVEIERDRHSVTLEIRDDGRGFRPGRRWADMEKNGHLGLSYSAQRAEAVGGLFDVTSAEGVGTTVRVVVPLSRRRSRLQRPSVAHTA